MCEIVKLMRQRGFIPIPALLSIIILVVLISGLFYWGMQGQKNNPNTEQPTVTMTPQPTPVVSTVPMQSLDLKVCDINTDGECDSLDIQLIDQSLGKKRGEEGYNPLADVDADGVITANDKIMVNSTTSIASPSGQK